MPIQLAWPDRASTLALAAVLYTLPARGTAVRFREADRDTDRRLRAFVDQHRIRAFIPAG